MPTHLIFFFFFFNDTATTEIYTLSLHDALPISHSHRPDLLVAQSRGSIRLELQLPVVRRIGRPDHWRRERDGAHGRSLQQSLHRSRNPAAHPVRARLLLLSGGRTRCRRTLRAHGPRPGAGHRNRLALLALYHLRLSATPALRPPASSHSPSDSACA